MDCDVVIIGAGPAGLFAARSLSGIGLKVIVVDKGKDISVRLPSDIMWGVGGAGTFSDGTLNLSPYIGGDLTKLTDVNQAYTLIEEVDNAFVEYGVTGGILQPSTEEVDRLHKSAASVGAKFIFVPQRHIGTDFAPTVIANFKRDLDAKGVQFKLETSVADIIVQKSVCKGVALENGGSLSSRYTLLAPGRTAAAWLSSINKKYGIKAKHGPFDLGVRIEVPSIIMDSVTRINLDPKFHIHTRSYDDFVRTFCTNREGFVVKEDYGTFVAVNGHSFREKKSPNTNFALLVRIELTEPLEDTTQYGECVAKLASTIGGRKPIIQRMGDLRRGQRSTFGRIRRNTIINTLEDVTPGDISMALPHRIVVDLTEALEVLDKIIPGVVTDSTLLYAPEIKFFAMKIEVNSYLETSLENLFVAGDGAGLSGDIVNAAATGILAARGISKKAQLS